MDAIGRIVNKSRPGRKWVVGESRVGTYVLLKFLGEHDTSRYLIFGCEGCALHGVITERRAHRGDTSNLTRHPCPECRKRATQAQAAAE